MRIPVFGDASGTLSNELAPGVMLLICTRWAKNSGPPWGVFLFLDFGGTDCLEIYFGNTLTCFTQVCKKKLILLLCNPSEGVCPKLGATRDTYPPCLAKIRVIVWIEPSQLVHLGWQTLSKSSPCQSGQPDRQTTTEETPVNGSVNISQWSTVKNLKNRKFKIAISTEELLGILERISGNTNKICSIFYSLQKSSYFLFSLRTLQIRNFKSPYSTGKLLGIGKLWATQR